MLEISPYGTAGRYKSSTRPRGTTLGTLANSNAVIRGSHESVQSKNLDELLDSVKNHYDAENDLVL